MGTPTTDTLPPRPLQCGSFRSRIHTGIAAATASFLLLLSSASGQSTQNDFVLGFFDVPQSEAAFGLVESVGGTHVHTYRMRRTMNAADSAEYFDMAGRYGLKVIANLDANREAGEGIEPLDQFVAALSSHPALGMWYVVDEPSIPSRNLTPAQSLALFDAVRAADPLSHPLSSSNPRSATWWHYFNSGPGAIYFVSAYPVAGEPPLEAPLQTFTNFIVTAKTRADLSNAPLFAVLQIFNWNQFYKGTDTYRGFPSSELRAPTAEEVRNMGFAALAVGARGIVCYSYGRSQRAYLQDVLGATLRELSDFGKQAEPSATLITEGEDPLKPLGLLRTFQSTDADWLLLVNNTPQERELVFANAPVGWADSTAEPWGQTRADAALQAVGNTLRVAAQPWEVFIWKKSK